MFSTLHLTGTRGITMLVHKDAVVRILPAFGISVMKRKLCTYLLVYICDKVILFNFIFIVVLFLFVSIEATNFIASFIGTAQKITVLWYLTPYIPVDCSGRFCQN
jgi:hypothetical protein